MFKPFIQNTIPRWKQIQFTTEQFKVGKKMITTKGLIRQARREKQTILRNEGLEKEFRYIERRFRKLGIELYLYTDSCPELLGSTPIYVVEAVAELPDGLIYKVANVDLTSVIRDLEDYLDNEGYN